MKEDEDYGSRLGCLRRRHSHNDHLNICLMEGYPYAFFKLAKGPVEGRMRPRNRLGEVVCLSYGSSIADASWYGGDALMLLRGL